MTSGTHKAHAADGKTADAIELTRRRLVVAAGIAFVAERSLLGGEAETAEARHQNGNHHRRRRRRKKGKQGPPGRFPQIQLNIHNQGGGVAVQFWLTNSLDSWIPSENRTLHEGESTSFTTNYHNIALLTARGVYIEVDVPINTFPNGTIATDATMSATGHQGTTLASHQELPTIGYQVSAGGVIIRFVYDHDDLMIYEVTLP